MSDNLRLRNPLGFQVTAFKVDDEFNAPVFKAPSQDTGIPLLNEDEGVMHRGAGSEDEPVSTPAQTGLPGAPATPTQGR
jgi:type IV secretion system protein VirB8